MKSNSEKRKQLLLNKIKKAVASQVEKEAEEQAAFFCDVFFKRVPLSDKAYAVNIK